MITFPIPAKTDWYFPDAYLPDTSNHISHEALCILNVSESDARIELTCYFEDREPLGAFVLECPAKRTKHFRLETLRNAKGQAIQECIPYALHISSSTPVLCQYTRVDATKPAYTLMTAMGL
jgi:hypothetical protein